MYRTVLLVSLAFLIPAFAPAQTSTDAGNSSRAFFAYITEGSGLWKTENKNYDPSQEGGFTHFLVHFESPDSQSVRGAISGITPQLDTVLFWEIWEFYAPHQGTPIMVQRSPYGTYTIATATFPNERERQCEMVFHYPNGATLRHRDVHRIISADKMVSESADYDAEKDDWGEVNTATWTREKGD